MSYNPDHPMDESEYYERREEVYRLALEEAIKAIDAGVPDAARTMCKVALRQTNHIACIRRKQKPKTAKQ